MQEVATGKPGQCAGVVRRTLALPQDGSVPVQAEEVEGTQDVVGRSRADARRIEVLDPDQPFAPVGARVEVAADGSDQRAKMQGAAGGGRETPPVAVDYRYQSSRSPNCFSRRSRRSWASTLSVATGRASRRFTPIGSPVSRQ